MIVAYKGPNTPGFLWDIIDLSLKCSSLALFAPFTHCLESLKLLVVYTLASGSGKSMIAPISPRLCSTPRGQPLNLGQV